MPTKNYVVRDGFNYRVRDEKGNEKVYSEGDSVCLDQEIGDVAHQLEYAEESDRKAALKIESAAKRAEQAAEVKAGGIDQEAFAAAIANGVAQALVQIQQSQLAPQG